MKKTIVALLVTGIIWSQSISAATLTLINGSGGVVLGGLGATVTGESDQSNQWNISEWLLNVAGVHFSNKVVVNYSFSSVAPNNKVVALFDGNFITDGDNLKLANGDHYLAMFPLDLNFSDGDFYDQPYQFSFTSTDVEVAQTPIPAAIWLFGSALVGVMRRKRV